MVLTLAKMHSTSVAQYDSLIDRSGNNFGPASYLVEDGAGPGRAWLVGRTPQQNQTLEELLGIKPHAVVPKKIAAAWFYSTQAPGGKSLGRVPGERGIPGFDLTFCAPKSVSLVWAFGDYEVRKVVNAAHAKAISAALAYLSDHAGYTRLRDKSGDIIVERLEGLSGVHYERRISRAGDPHIYSHVLLVNRQLCVDGKGRAIDSTSLYHEARAGGMLYQAVLRAELSQTLGVRWGTVTSGCAEISGLNSPEIIKAFSARTKEIKSWQQQNDMPDYVGARIGQKMTRSFTYTDGHTPDHLHSRWMAHDLAPQIQKVIKDFPMAKGCIPSSSKTPLPTPEEVVNAIVEERSTFTRSDLVEKTTELMPVSGVNPADVLGHVETIVEEIIDTGRVWSTNPDMARSRNKKAREGSQRFAATDG